MTLWIFLIFTIVTKGNANECMSRTFGNDGIVCVCNRTYCDFIEDQGPPEEFTFHWYVSDKSGQRMNYTKGYMSKQKTINGSIISIIRGIRYQTILGFGTTITDSAAINFRSVSLPTQDNLIHSYFGEKGSRYSFSRVPIGGTDFSTRRYTLDDVENDKNLKYFSLAPEDLYYKIPLLQKSALLNENLKLIAVPWSAPKWMKIVQSYSGYGLLKQKYYQTFSDYLIKFLDAYSKFGMGFWGLSIGNEPQNAIIPLTHKMTMAWTPSNVAKFIGNNLGPSLNKSSHNRTRILILDDSLDSVSWYVKKVLKNKHAKPFVKGTAIHYHYTTITGKNVLDKIHKNYPNNFILMTEASELFSKQTCFGCWDQSVNYILEMFSFFQHWIVGWINLNPALNEDGGPNLSPKIKHSASIIVDAKNDQFFKLPLYYIIQHFSRFIPPGSIRIHTKISFQPLYDAIQVLAFETPEKETVVLVYNKNNLAYNIGIDDENEGFINFVIKEFSLNTIIFKR